MFEKVWFKNSKGLKLSGLIIKPKGNGPFPLIINAHDFRGSGKGGSKAKRYAKLFPKLGYALFLFDFQACGESQGKFINLTVSGEIDDLNSALKFIVKKKYINKNRIGLIGSSLGGMVSILYAAKTNLIRSLVLISPVSYFNNLSVVRISLKEWKKRGWTYTYSETTGEKFELGYNFHLDGIKYNVFKETKNIHCPVLIIQAGKDSMVPVLGSKKLYKIFDGPKKLFLVKGADHWFKEKGALEQILRNAKDWFNKYLKKKTDKVMICFLQREDGKILLLRRSNKVGAHKDRWNGIGGYLEGNTPVKTAKKEAFEELGIESKYLKLIKVGEPFYMIENKIDKHWFIYPILMKTKKTKIKLNWEATDYCWIRPEEYKKFKTVPRLKLNLKRLGLI